MKPIGRIACAALLSLSLVACGTQAPSSDASSKANDSQATSSSQTNQSTQDGQDNAKADASTFEGTWKLAAYIRDGATVTSDFTVYFGIPEGNTVTVKSDGTGTITTGSESVDFTWKAVGDDTISISNEYDPGDTTATLKENTLTFESKERSDKMVYTKDGTYPDVPNISFEKKGVPTASSLAGTWEYCALRNTDYGDFLAFGTAEDLAEFGDFSSGELTFNEDGTGNLLGSSMTWMADKNDVTITLDDTGKSLSVIETDNGIACKSNVDGAVYAFKKQG